jgi:hypothetical protein
MLHNQQPKKERPVGRRLFLGGAAAGLAAGLGGISIGNRAAPPESAGENVPAGKTVAVRLHPLAVPRTNRSSRSNA